MTMQKIFDFRRSINIIEDPTRRILAKIIVQNMDF
jgi:hypothetical protein